MVGNRRRVQRGREQCDEARGLRGPSSCSTQRRPPSHSPTLDSWSGPQPSDGLAVNISVRDAEVSSAPVLVIAAHLVRALGVAWLCLRVTPGAAACRLAFLEPGALLPVLDLASQAVSLWVRCCPGHLGIASRACEPARSGWEPGPPGTPTAGLCLLSTLLKAQPPRAVLRADSWPTSSFGKSGSCWESENKDVL